MRGLPERLGQGQAVALLFCSLMAALSQIPGWRDLLFPEMAALSSTLLRDPGGPWARSNVQLIALPTLCAGVGVWISSHCSDASAALLLAVLAAKVLLLLARSPLVPSLSAAALPVLLQIHSWIYPLQIGLGLLGLVLLLAFWRRRLVLPAGGADPAAPIPPVPGLGDLLHPGTLRWLALLTLLLLIERMTGLRDVLVPPLIVIAHEGFCAPARCDWRRRRWLLPLACGTSALVGVLAAQHLPSAALATALSLLAVLLLQRLWQLQLAPLLALGLLPQVLPEPDLRLVPAVMLGSTLLAFTLAVTDSPARTPPGPAAAPDRSRAPR